MSIFRCDILSQAFRYMFTKKRFVPVVATVFSLTAGLEILVGIWTSLPSFLNRSACTFRKFTHFPLKASQGLHRLKKYLNLEDFLQKSLKIKSALKSTGKSLKSLEKSLNSIIFCRS